MNGSMALRQQQQQQRECVFIKNSSKHTPEKLWNIWKKCLQLLVLFFSFRCQCRRSREIEYCRCWTSASWRRHQTLSKSIGRNSAAANNRNKWKKSSTIKRLFFSFRRLDASFIAHFNAFARMSKFLHPHQKSSVPCSRRRRHPFIWLASPSFM